jgi:hypothetical protein
MDLICSQMLTVLLSGALDIAMWAYVINLSCGYPAYVAVLSDLCRAVCGGMRTMRVCGCKCVVWLQGRRRAAAMRIAAYVECGCIRDVAPYVMCLHT